MMPNQGCTENAAVTSWSHSLELLSLTERWCELEHCHANNTDLTVCFFFSSSWPVSQGLNSTRCWASRHSPQNQWESRHDSPKILKASKLFFCDVQRWFPWHFPFFWLSFGLMDIQWQWGFVHSDDIFQYAPKSLNSLHNMTIDELAFLLLKSEVQIESIVFWCQLHLIMSLQYPHWHLTVLWAL